jgi:hypothetical protein
MRNLVSRASSCEVVAAPVTFVSMWPLSYTHAVSTKQFPLKKPSNFRATCPPVHKALCSPICTSPAGCFICWHANHMCRPPYSAVHTNFRLPRLNRSATTERLRIIKQWLWLATWRQSNIST